MDINKLLKEEISTFEEKERQLINSIFEELSKEHTNYEDIKYNILKELDELMEES